MGDVKVLTLEAQMQELVRAAIEDDVEVEIPHGLQLMFQKYTGALLSDFKYRYERPASGGLKRCIARYEPETTDIGR